LDIAENKIQGILIAGKGFETDLVRVSTEAWTMGGKPADPAPVNSLIGSLAHLRADDFVDPTAAPGLSYENLTYAEVKVKGSDSSADLRIGAQDPKSKRYPVSTGKDNGLAWVAETTLKAILQKPSAFNTKYTRREAMSCRPGVRVFGLSSIRRW
jgi:hypothetical protein